MTDGQGTARRLLVIDDEPEFAEYVRKVAEGLGYEATATGAFAAFRDQVERRMPDTIVLDLVMPEKDGIEILNWLIEFGYSGKLVVATGYNPDFARMTAQLAVARGRMSVTTLAKPVRLGDLRAALA